MLIKFPNTLDEEKMVDYEIQYTTISIFLVAWHQATHSRSSVVSETLVHLWHLHYSRWLVPSPSPVPSSSAVPLSETVLNASGPMSVVWPLVEVGLEVVGQVDVECFAK